MVDEDPTADERATVDERPGQEIRAAEITTHRYELGQQIASGGMGEVLAARDVQFGRDVAIKRLITTAPSNAQVSRFLREAQIQGRLEHPSIVPVHELGRDRNGLPFFAMKKLSGTTLAELIRSGAPLQRLLRAFVDVCLAIEYAHVNGVLHRDLKPANIVLGEYGEVYVLDWGVAKVIHESDDFGDIHNAPGGTIAGAVVGTPMFMSPEQERGVVDIDGRTDVFALGRVLECILGTDPPPELVAIANEATVLDRNARLRTARELGDRVQRFLDGDRDLELRRQAARDHLARADELTKQDTTQAHSEALGLVGRALVLDPANPDGVNTLVTLLTSPPRDVPAAALDEMRATERSLDRTRIRAGTLALGILTFGAIAVPPVLGIVNITLYVLMAAALTVAFVLGVVRRRRPDGNTPTYLVIAIGCGVCAIGIGFHPDLVTPQVGTVMIIGLTLSRPRWGYLPLTMGAVAFTVPVVLEWMHIVPKALVERGGMLCMISRSSHLIETAALGPLAVNVAVLFGGAMFAVRLREALTTALRRNSITTWQLRQLVRAPRLTGSRAVPAAFST